MKRLLSYFAVSLLALPALAQGGGELRFCLRSEPKTFDPVLVADVASETVRYLTGGVLIRLNRQTQNLEPDLAESWKVLEQGRRITFRLRQGVRFSDGSPFTASDVAHTVRHMMDPSVVSATGDAFRSGRGPVEAREEGPYKITLLFPAPIAGVEGLFDQMPVMSARQTNPMAAVLGPFALAEHKPGAYLLLRRNPHYWKRDAGGRQLPYLDSVRLDIQQNRELELLRFRKGEIHLIDNLDPEIFERLAAEAPGTAHDAGPSQEGEIVWFNQTSAAVLPEFKKAWFGSRQFRLAISEAIQRADICRLAYRGRALPAAGPYSASNKFWSNANLKAHAFNPDKALSRLRGEGFQFSDGQLKDRAGNAVQFSLVTNAGNKIRARAAAMIQQDLARIGVRVNVVTLDFPSLIERITRSFDYEACLLGFSNVELDPNTQMNVWLSSGANHPWSPSQKSPATVWEAEIDRLMRAQASNPDPKQRKTLFDRVQEIVSEEAPVIYIAHRNSLVAISPQVRNAAPVVLRPQAYWNIDRLQLSSR